MTKLKKMKPFLIFLALFAVWHPAFADPPLPTPVGRVVWVKGILTAEMDNNEKRILQKQSVIYLKDSLITDDKTQAQVVFSDNTLLTFREGTQFKIDEYKFEAGVKKGSVGKYVVSLIQGGFRTITGLIAKNKPSDYKVNTPVATIGVRGTEYAVAYTNGELDIGYYHGTPCVSGKDNKKTCLSEKDKYAKVGKDGNVMLSNNRPTSLEQDLTIEPASIAPFTAPWVNKNSGGPITSFCIQ
ncbi:MAG: FecR family protein [Gammaproteobacteria bacterium]